MDVRDGVNDAVGDVDTEDDRDPDLVIVSESEPAENSCDGVALLDSVIDDDFVSEASWEPDTV